MKFSFKTACVILFLAFAAFACQSDEAFVTKEDGLWNVVQRTTQVYENEVLTKDTTETDSLGQFEFVKGGGGYRYDKKGVREDIQWVVNAKEDQITIYGATEFINGYITSRTDNSISFKWELEQGVGQPVVVLTKHTTKLQR